ncbi:hypothetical protein ATE90_2259 [Polaribacter sp. Hel1_33_96]|nr:hypothetical protein ATE90_2259 [Polaribacter sp. Hel1_33_96]
MLNQQLKQMSETLKKLKSKKVISKDDEIKIKSLERFFNNYLDEE